MYLFIYFKGPILYCFSSISQSCLRSSDTVFEMHRPKPICCPEIQLSKSRSSELYWEQAVSVPAPLNANELCLSTPALPATRSIIELQCRRPLAVLDVRMRELKLKSHSEKDGDTANCKICVKH